MEDKNKIIELAKKLFELKEKGVGGEKDKRYSLYSQEMFFLPQSTYNIQEFLSNIKFVEK